MRIVLPNDTTSISCSLCNNVTSLMLTVCMCVPRASTVFDEFVGAPMTTWIYWSLFGIKCGCFPDIACASKFALLQETRGQSGNAAPWTDTHVQCVSKLVTSVFLFCAGARGITIGVKRSRNAGSDDTMDCGGDQPHVRHTAPCALSRLSAGHRCECSSRPGLLGGRSRGAPAQAALNRLVIIRGGDWNFVAADEGRITTAAIYPSKLQGLRGLGFSSDLPELQSLALCRGVPGVALTTRVLSGIILFVSGSMRRPC